MKLCYSFYFQQKHAIFVFQAQVEYRQFLQLKQQVDLIKEFTQIDKFKEYQMELKKEAIYQQRNTLCFDIIGVFLAELNPEIEDDWDLIQQIKPDSMDFIVIKRIETLNKLRRMKKLESLPCLKPACNLRQIGDELCICHKRIFKVRPYTY